MRLRMPTTTVMIMSICCFYDMSLANITNNLKNINTTDIFRPSKKEIYIKSDNIWQNRLILLHQKTKPNHYGNAY